MAMLRYSVAALTLTCAANAETLKVGAFLQDSGSMAATASKGKQALELWRDWVNSSATMTFDVSLIHFAANNDTAIATDVAAATAPSGGPMVDVVICPYASGASTTCVGAVDAAFTGPIMIWGGASDSLFDTHCVGKPCFGFFTVGSQYMTSGIGALNDAYSGQLTVALIENDNGFSTSVCDGLNATIAAAGGLAEVISVSTSEKDSLPAVDVPLIDDVIAAAADVVAICGHNGFVEPVITQIAQDATYTPKAIIATNSITGTATTNFGANSDYQECVMMPTQWAESDASPDTIIGWTSTDFKNALGTAATYHSAAAAAAGIAITHAMHGENESTRISNLQNRLATMSIDSFYGTLSWDSDGRISKPMYTQQKQCTTSPMVAPSSDSLVTGTPNTDLSTCAGWGGAACSDATTPGGGGSGSDASGARAAATMAVASMLAMLAAVAF